MPHRCWTTLSKHFLRAPQINESRKPTESAAPDLIRQANAKPFIAVILFVSQPTHQAKHRAPIPPLLRPQTVKFVRKFGVIISEPDSYNHHRVHPFLGSVLINIANEIKIELRITETNNFNFKCERFGDSSPSLTFQGHPNWTRTRSKSLIMRSN